MKRQPMTICLWYDDKAEEAARFYTSIFADSKITQITRYGKEGFEFHGKPEGTAMAIDFRLNRMKFIAVNGGPLFKFNESVSIVVYCATQEEIDHYWTKLTKGGQAQSCGWLKDKFGVSWQITPSVLPKYLTDKDIQRRSRVEKAAFTMKKFNLKKLNDAYHNGK